MTQFGVQEEPVQEMDDNLLQHRNGLGIEQGEAARDQKGWRNSNAEHIVDAIHTRQGG